MIPGGDAEYDDVAVRAGRANGNGNGTGGGADTEVGLAKSGATSAAVDTRGRLRIKVRCSRRLEGACKVGLNGLVKRHGPKLTARRHVRVNSGSAREVTLRVKIH